MKEVLTNQPVAPDEQDIPYLRELHDYTCTSARMDARRNWERDLDRQVKRYTVALKELRELLLDGVEGKEKLVNFIIHPRVLGEGASAEETRDFLVAYIERLGYQTPFPFEKARLRGPGILGIGIRLPVGPWD